MVSRRCTFLNQSGGNTLYGMLFSPIQSLGSCSDPPKSPRLAVLLSDADTTGGKKATTLIKPNFFLNVCRNGPAAKSQSMIVLFFDADAI
jgi:hypothetical protein